MRRSILIVAVVLTACDNNDTTLPAEDLPGSGLYATFAVGSETFHASITSDEGKRQARALWDGSSSASIPTALLICDPASWNTPWTWHLDPDDLRFAEVTTEVCDGEPSYVEANCDSFGGGRYCPWSAQMTGLRDCDANPACPAIAH